jgi:hypothetical protein
MTETGIIRRETGNQAMVASQTTLTEQARAVAEVQAAVTVAQQVRRDQGRAEAEMRATCERLTVAQKAFYTVPNRGSGPTVHLMRELARIWGNIDYGVREMRRDDHEGISEIQAYAWDQETNVRSTRSFIVPHERMARKSRQKLTDLGDIYLNNQNVGARAVRECIATVLPSWFTDEAQAICHATLQHGDGTPLADRVGKMLAAFKTHSVTQAMIEARLKRPRTAWTAGDLAELTTIFQSLERREITVEEAFPQAVTVDELTGEVSE